MSEIARQANIQASLKQSSTPDVSLELEHIRHYLELADDQSHQLHSYVKGSEGVDISNRIGWLLDDVQNILAKVQDTLYPDDRIATTTTDNSQLLMDLLSSPEPIHFGTLILPTIEQLSQLADPINTAYQYAASQGDDTLCQLLQQIKSQMDDMYPKLIKPGETLPDEINA